MFVVMRTSTQRFSPEVFPIRGEIDFSFRFSGAAFFKSA